MADLLQWLTELGLERYAAVFEENDIDLDILPDLTDQDLERMGVSLGHRRRILRAIATENAPVPETPAADALPAVQTPAPAAQKTATAAVDESATTPTPSSPPEAERRQVTVMFCDIVGSTELAAAVDPEDMGDLLRRYQDACAGAIARFDGFLAKFMGDGVLAYFGFPHTFEDEAERAIHAALAIIAEVGAIERPDGRPLESRIGIATGVVVVGDIIGTGVAREQTIVGETPNLAARLQAIAEPNSVLITSSTMQLVGGLFEYQSLGDHEIKGYATPIPVWQVMREAAVASRFAASRTATLTPFVNREHEMGLMIDRWRLAKAGEGQMVLLTGEAGIGKSRIIDIMLERTSGDAYRQIRCQCSPYYANSALYPLTQYLEQAADFVFDDSPEVKRDKLAAMLAEIDTPADNVALLEDLLSILSGEGLEPDALTASERRAATIAALTSHVTRSADRRPVIFVMEDAHWIDPTTAEFVTEMLDGIAAARVMVIVTARLPFVPPWTGRSHVSLITLNRLGRDHCTTMIKEVAALHAMTPALLEEIVAKTDGVPLFVEELTKAVFESTAPARGAVPATLHDSLMARLDRLGDVKEIALVASVIGRQFSYSLLAAVAPITGKDLENAMARLVEAEVVFPQSRALEAGYSFKHALACDAAYGSLLRERRRDLHERVARALEERFPKRAATEPEVVAYHFGAAGRPELASTYWERAGDRAIKRSAYSEAVAHFNLGLDEINSMPPGTERDRRELVILLKLGPAVTVLKNPQVPEIEKIYLRAHELGGTLEEGHAMFKASWGLWLVSNTSQNEMAQKRADDLVALGHRLQDDHLLLEAFHCRWSTAFFQGDIAQAMEDGHEGIRRYDSEQHRHLAAWFGGHDPGVCAFTMLAVAQSIAGHFAAARKSADEGIALAELLEHPFTLTHGLTNAAIASQIVGDRDAVNKFAERLLGLAEKYKFPMARASGRFLAEWARAAAPYAQALEPMEAEFIHLSAVAAQRNYCTALLAEVCVEAGQPAKALALVDRALTLIRQPGVGQYVPELHRIRGLCLLALDPDDTNDAIESFQTAFEIAGRQGAHLLALRAAISLATMEKANGGPGAAFVRLREIHSQFTDGTDSPDLASAQALLDG